MGANRTRSHHRIDKQPTVTDESIIFGAPEPGLRRCYKMKVVALGHVSVEEQKDAVANLPLVFEAFEAVELPSDVELLTLPSLLVHRQTSSGRPRVFLSPWTVPGNFQVFDTTRGDPPTAGSAYCT